MAKRIIFLSMCIILCLVTVLGLCSCNRKFNYDWTALDAFMEEHGEVNTFLTQFQHGDGNSKTIVITHEKDDETKTVIQLVKIEATDKYRYYLQFEVLYFTFIPNKTVKLEFLWWLPYDNHDKYYDNHNWAEISCYDTDYNSAEEYWLSLDKVGIIINNLQLDDEGRFLKCEYLFQNIYSFDKHEYYKEIDLEKTYDYYFNEMLSKLFNITTKYLNANNIPLFYDFAKNMRESIVISTDPQ